MRALCVYTSIGTLIVLLSACSAPPKPPSVNEAHKRPANTQTAVELQVCQNELQNTRILATEASRAADTATATLARLSARQQLLASMQKQAMANRVHIVPFAFNSTHLSMAPAQASAMVEEAKDAPLVVLRGRTDGASDTAAESQVAQARANAVRDYLVACGVDPARIRTTHQPSGDHLGDNRSPQGRHLNRRVEVEVYRALPVIQQASPPPQP
ncbi:MAG: OmpA family protein [Hydrogenophaga sp.]|jgi:outer membrane protein OmpA-like peptidoglycan-associated protein|nr:OmpA family protein [Hydrogenophaga sp.]